jgi:hypothetical protein
MEMVIHLLALQWGAVAVGLSLVWRKHPSPKFRTILAACVPVLYLIAARTLIPFFPTDHPAGRKYIEGFLLLNAIFWCYWLGRVLFTSLKPIAQEGAAGFRRWMAADDSTLLIAGVLLLLLNFGLSAFVLGHCFIVHDPLHPVPEPLLILLIGLGELTGAFLMSAVVFAVLDEGGAGDAGTELETLRICTAIQYIQAAVVFRVFAVVASLGLGGYFNPLGSWYFFDRLYRVSYTLIGIRIILGLILPTLFACVAVGAMRRRERKQAIDLFTPAFIVVLIGEILAAGLTVGMYGIAF